MAAAAEHPGRKTDRHLLQLFKIDFDSPDLANKLIEIFNRYTVDPRQIAIEITESVVQENNATAQRNIEASAG
jgi:EAL domain-containing protein (putative c-di-GMP-specific phosphodiesterase class I)